jgi:AmmeMemoRadiSam system protein B
MNHYESQDATMKKDQFAIEGILHMDPEELYREVHRHRVTMCGVIPATIALIAAKKLGAKKAELIRHATSGDVTGDYDSVVGYASFVIF